MLTTVLVAMFFVGLKPISDADIIQVQASEFELAYTPKIYKPGNGISYSRKRTADIMLKDGRRATVNIPCVVDVLTDYYTGYANSYSREAKVIEVKKGRKSYQRFTFEPFCSIDKVVTLPLVRDDELFAVKVILDEQYETYAVIDSGLGVSKLDSNYKTSLSPTNGDPERKKEAGYGNHTVRFGDSKAVAFNPVEKSLKAQSGLIAGYRSGLVLGCDVLNEFAFSVDYQKKSLTLYPSGYLTRKTIAQFFGEKDKGGEFRVLHLKDVDNLPYIYPMWGLEVRLVKKSDKVMFCFDTGAGILGIAKSYLEPIDIQKVTMRPMISWQGYTFVNEYDLGEIVIQGYRYGPFRCIDWSGDQVAGVIGPSALTTQRFIVDPHRRLLFLPETSDNER